jgi:chemosensory pili system protein ChpA (sensor histidine kinase/response regulator)
MFQILARERVAELAGRVCRRLSALSEASGPAPAAVIDALAVALSAIESYLDDMPHPSVRTDARIEVAIEELTATEPSDSEIVTIFVDELEDHVSTLEQFVGRCRRRAADCRASDELRRALHTVAGSARAVNYSALADAYQAATLVLDGVAHRDGMLRATQLAILDDLAKLSRHALRDLKSKRAISPSLLASFAGLARSTDAVVETPLTAATHASQAEQADFLGIFLDEASDILARMEDGLREWRSGQGADEVLAGLRRELHTLKGSARAVGVETMGELSHSTETLLDRLGNNGTEYAATGLHALLEEVHDALVSAVAQLRTGQVPGRSGHHHLRGRGPRLGADRTRGVRCEHRNGDTAAAQPGAGESGIAGPVGQLCR